MTPQEQIKWIQADVREFCMTRCRDRPKLAYLVSPTDVTAMTRDHSIGLAGCRWFEMHTAAGYVDVRGDPDKPSGVTPVRCYRCPCGELFINDSSRSGKCAGCLQRRVVTAIRTSVGDIPVIADPTLRPDEFRLVDPTEEFARRALADSVSRDTSAMFDFDRMLDEHYPRDENGRHYIPAPPKVDWSKIQKAPRGRSFRWFEPVGEDHDVKPENAARPDGFAQSRIDEIKAMLTARVEKRR